MFGGGFHSWILSGRSIVVRGIVNRPISTFSEITYEEKSLSASRWCVFYFMTMIDPARRIDELGTEACLVVEDFVKLVLVIRTPECSFVDKCTVLSSNDMTGTYIVESASPVAAKSE